MSEEIHLRRASESDAERIATLFRTTFRQNLPYLPELHTAQEDLEYFGNVIKDQHVIVAHAGEMVVGFCAYRNNWLNHLYVLPERQGQGVGTSLLDSAKYHNTDLRLWVFQKNTDAIAFYERNGFEFKLARDGQENEEHEPDALYAWSQIAPGSKP